MIRSILQIRELRLRKVKQLFYNHNIRDTSEI